MYEIHELAAAVAEEVLHVDCDYVQPESRLFRDLQALAIDALCADPGGIVRVRLSQFPLPLPNGNPGS